MARRPRIIHPGELYHVTQRGSRKQPVFGDEEDFEKYLTLLRRNLEKRDVLLHQYCCMTNHVHLLVQPFDLTGLPRAIQVAHSSYARFVNEKNAWVGHLWHSRFRSSRVFPDALVHVVRYIARNPVEAHLVSKAVDWPHASTRDLAGIGSDPYITSRILNGIRPNWSEEFSRPMSQAGLRELQSHLHQGHPVGTAQAA